MYYGRLPGFHLSASGRMQAEQLARRLEHERVSCIYTSPLARAVQTAQVLAKHIGGEVVLNDALLEARSSWDGAPVASLPPAFNIYEPPKHPSDENITTITSRVVNCLMRIVEIHLGEHVLCVTHGDLIRCLRAFHAGLPPVLSSIRGAGPVDPCSVTRAIFQERRLISFDYMG